MRTSSDRPDADSQRDRRHVELVVGELVENPPADSQVAVVDALLVRQATRPWRHLAGTPPACSGARIGVGAVGIDLQRTVEVRVGDDALP